MVHKFLHFNFLVNYIKHFAHDVNCKVPESWSCIYMCVPRRLCNRFGSRLFNITGHMSWCRVVQFAELCWCLIAKVVDWQLQRDVNWGDQQGQVQTSDESAPKVVGDCFDDRRSWTTAEKDGKMLCLVRTRPQFASNAAASKWLNLWANAKIVINATQTYACFFYCAILEAKREWSFCICIGRSVVVRCSSGHVLR